MYKKSDLTTRGTENHSPGTHSLFSHRFPSLPLPLPFPFLLLGLDARRASEGTGMDTGMVSKCDEKLIMYTSLWKAISGLVLGSYTASTGRMAGTASRSGF